MNGDPKKIDNQVSFFVGFLRGDVQKQGATGEP